MADAAYVFIYLPGQLHPTVAGRFELDTAASPALGQFVYGTSYLSNSAALVLDPIALPLREQLFRTTLSSGFFGGARIWPYLPGTGRRKAPAAMGHRKGRRLFRPPIV